MDDSGKTKEQLLEELAALRQRVAQLAAAESQQKETEAALRKNEARFVLAMQGTDEGVWDWDIVTNEACFTPRFRELLGYRADEFWETLESFTSRLHPDDYDGTQRAIQAHLEDRKPYDREYRLQTKSGQYRWFHERGQAVWDEQGNPVRMAGSIRDITAHKQMEESLQVSEARFALAMRGTDEGLWDWDIVTNEAYFAPRFQELLGYEAGEFEKTLASFTSRLHPDDYDGTQRVIQTHLEDRKPYDLEYRLQTKSGQYRWFHARGQAVWDEQGNPVRMAGSIRDITAHKQMEESLQVSEARFRSLSDASPSGIFQNDMTGACIYTNPRWQEISGVSLEESLGSNWGKRIVPEDREATFVEWGTCVREEREFSCEFRVARPNGEVRWIHARAAPVRSDQGVAVGYVGTAEDITESKQAEETLRASEARFRALSTFSPVGIYQTDGKGQCVYTNSRWQEITGLSEAASIGDGWTSVIDPRDKDDVFTAWQRCVAKNQPFILEFRFCRPNGEVCWVHSRAAALHSGAALHSDADVDMGHVGTVIDITERKRAEEEILRYTQEVEEARTRVEAQAAALTKQTEDLARSNTELEQFAYIASHDLQEPLRKVQAFGDRLKTKYAAALDERGLDYLERMRNSAQRMQILIKDLLTYARVTSKARPLVSVDLTVLAQEVVADLEARIERTRGRVEVGYLPTLAADPTQLRQLLQNLIGNALKFHHPEVPPVVTVQAQPALAGTLASANPPAAYQITVQDNGIGFDEEYREQIFAPFQRLHGRGQYEGTGIGLAVCRKIARRHGGDITVASAPGQGTMFTVTLPVSPPADDAQLV